MTQTTDPRQTFIDMLKSTQRYGVDTTLEYLDEIGFFTAPASASHHLNTEGGNVIHALNVANAALKIWEGMAQLDPTLEKEVSRQNVIIAALLHDVCKSDIYKRTVKKRKDPLTGTYEDCEGYKITYKNFPMGHGEKSLIMLLYNTSLELSDSEMLAIRWHMGAWGINLNSYEEIRNFDTAHKLHPWYQ